MPTLTQKHIELGFIVHKTTNKPNNVVTDTALGRNDTNREDRNSKLNLMHDDNLHNTFFPNMTTETVNFYL